MAREMYLVGVDEEELKPDPKPEPPRGPLNKLSNFWYHYKWLVIVITAVAALSVWLIGQLITRKEPDIRVELVTGSELSIDAIDILERELARYAPDVDGDGNVTVEIDYIWLEGEIEPNRAAQRDQVNRSKLMTHLAAGDIMFFVFDPDLYESIIVPKESDEYIFFAPVTGVIGAQTGLSEDGRSYNWAGSELQQKLKDSGFPQDLLFGVRDVAGTASGGRSARMFEGCEKLLTALVNNTPHSDAE